MAGGQCSGLSSGGDPLCRQPSRLLLLPLTGNPEPAWTRADVRTGLGDLERGRTGDCWNEKNLNLNWIGSDLLSCAYRGRPQRKHPISVVICYSFGLRVRGGYEMCWRDWRADSQCVWSWDADACL